MTPLAALAPADPKTGPPTKWKEMNRQKWFGLLTAISVAVVWLDIVTPPYVFFPILFVVPVELGTWFLGRATGMGFALALVASRFWVAVTFEVQFIPVWAASLNAGIRLVLLVGLTHLLSRITDQKHMLENRVQELEGILPICSFCKKIHNTDGTWERVEQYVTKRSAAEFSHGVCEECERIHYGADIAPQQG